MKQLYGYICWLRQGGLDYLDGVKGEGKICNFLKIEIFSKSSELEVINKNYHKYNCLAIMMHYRFMGNQSYVMLCSKMASFQPSEGVGEITIVSI